MCKYKTLGYTGLFSLHIERPSYVKSKQQVKDSIGPLKGQNGEISSDLKFMAFLHPHLHEITSSNVKFKEDSEETLQTLINDS